jgi:type II secretory pathway component PulF
MKSSVPTPAATATTPELFSFQAQSDSGQRMSGSLEAASAEAATERLRAMQMRVIEVQAVKPVAPGTPLTGQDFAAFNQQLAQLTAAGLPVEKGLRLIAADTRRGGHARLIEQLAAELESGTPLDQALDKFGTKFPPLYGQLVKAGIKSGNLSGVLLSLGRHVELVHRLRAMLWRTVSYPLVVLVAVGFLLVFLGWAVLPQFEKIFADFHLRLPAVTEALMAVGRAAPIMVGAILVVVVGGPILWTILQRLGYGGGIAEQLAIRMPLIGPVLRSNLIARWCDVVRIGVEAGLDLPASIALANDATGSARLTSDGLALSQALAAGRPLTAATTRLLPPTIPTAMQLASGHQDLGTTLRSLTDLYERQAELRMNAIPGLLTPTLLLLMSLVIGFVIAGLMWPLLSLINGLATPWGGKGPGL